MPTCRGYGWVMGAVTVISRSGANTFGSSEGVTVPMIPLGLKETKELDWATPLKVSSGLQTWRNMTSLGA
jgi:hypothetical protein